MKKFKHFFFCFLLFYTCFSCAQNKETNQPIYTLKITSGNPYEIYINDMILEKDYLPGSTDNELIINDLILKSGKQKLRIVLFPNERNKIVDKLGIDYLKLSIYKYNEGYQSYVERKSTLVCEFKLDKQQGEIPIIDKDWFFDAEVPYTLKSWENGVNLSKEDKDILTKEVVNYYNDLGRIINKGDKSSFLNIMKEWDSQVFKSLYNDTKVIKDDEEYVDNRLSKSRGSVQLIKNYKMLFYGKGKIVTLEDEKGETPLFGSDKDNIYSYQIYLYRPALGAPLEVIR